MGYMNSQYRRVVPAQIEQRAAPRHPVVLQSASVRGRTAQPYDAELVDLSIYGCRIFTSATFKPDDQIWLGFEGHVPVAATAIWCEGDNIGCRFDVQLERGIFRSLTLLTE